MKDFSIQLRDTVTAITNVINSSNLHIDIIELILKDLYNEVHAKAEENYRNALISESEKLNAENSEAIEDIPLDESL